MFISDNLLLIEATRSRVYSRSPEFQKIDEAIKYAEETAASFETVSRWYSDLSSARRGDSAWLAMQLDEKIRTMQSIVADDLVDLERKLEGDSRAAVNSVKRW
jgi:hypothetical protein